MGTRLYLHTKDTPRRNRYPLALLSRVNGTDKYCNGLCFEPVPVLLLRMYWFIYTTTGSSIDWTREHYDNTSTLVEIYYAKVIT